MAETAWEKINSLPFKDDIIADLKSEMLRPVLRETSHATLIAVGRQELAMELLIRIGDV